MASRNVFVAVGNDLTAPEVKLCASKCGPTTVKPASDASLSLPKSRNTLMISVTSLSNVIVRLLRTVGSRCAPFGPCSIVLGFVSDPPP